MEAAAAALCETARLHLKPVAQTSGFEMPVASAVYTHSSTRIFMGSYKMIMVTASTITTTTAAARRRPPNSCVDR